MEAVRDEGRESVPFQLEKTWEDDQQRSSMRTPSSTTEPMRGYQFEASPFEASLRKLGDEPEYKLEQAADFDEVPLKKKAWKRVLHRIWARKDKGGDGEPKTFSRMSGRMKSSFGKSSRHRQQALRQRRTELSEGDLAAHTCDTTGFPVRQFSDDDSDDSAPHSRGTKTEIFARNSSLLTGNVTTLHREHFMALGKKVGARPPKSQRGKDPTKQEPHSNSGPLSRTDDGDDGAESFDSYMAFKRGR